ncbi:hypothetical protein H0194_06235 [Corynebacterium incognita]|uniref:Uncharacterized protein n=1 Tax=Corynebacterium incognita TaxID=2754725 RepID=A0A7G7CM92_9CORY|nr:hypothetical protein [Corynebacterium incognita]QNE88708.1 hypothetical protein H0194_06235 [Corynebacterium incognita]
MFGFGKKRYNAEEDKRNGVHMAAQHTNVPLNDFMTRLMAEEIPFLDTAERQEIYALLEEHRAAGKPDITSQDELPPRIREIMDL